MKEFLLNHAKKNPISFHMPGHKGAKIYDTLGYSDFLENIMDCDVTEIPGADNLFQAEGIIEEVQKKYAQLYEVKKSFLLINGTSGGILASIMASVPKGKKLIMARNCHKSVFNALYLTGAEPIYAYPSFIEEYGISGEIKAEEINKLLEENKDAAAVILPSPNYYGICSDIEKIAEIVHAHNKILIVDQAHGAHLKFMQKCGINTLPKSAEESGADIIINSIHKTLASFTQTAILNLNSDRIDEALILDKLQCIESTSPSYILMASLDINAAILEKHNDKLMKSWIDNLNYFYNEISQNKYIKCFKRASNMDYTKLNFSLDRLPLSGNELEKILNDKYNIFIELYTGKYVMAMTGIGNTREHYQKLIDALNEITQELKKSGVKEEQKSDNISTMYSRKKPELYAMPHEKKLINIQDSEGLICASSLIPYPPGIPLVCPGEKIEKEDIELVTLLRQRGEKVIGINKNNEILVG